MKTIADIVQNIDLKQISPLPERSVNVESWSAWFKFDLRKGSQDYKQMCNMVSACARFVLAMKENKQPHWVSLVGSSGAGKTYLAKRILKWHRDCRLFNDGTSQGKGLVEVVYAREWCWWPGLSRLLKSNDGYGQLRDMESASFSVIDEIGSDLDKSGHVTDCLSNGLASRVGMWTIITSNKTLDQIDSDIDRRVASRMVRDGSEVVDVNVEDYNLWKKIGQH